MTTAKGAAVPAPLPEALTIPTTSGTRNAIEKTGPISPTDWATVSIRVSRRLPPSWVRFAVSGAITPPCRHVPPARTFART